MNVNIEIDLVKHLCILDETAKTVNETLNNTVQMETNASSPEKDISSSFYAMSHYF